MSTQRRSFNVGQAVQVAQLLSLLANMNWKGLNTMLSKIKAWFSLLNPKAYWGHLILIMIGGVLIGFILFDWRSQAVQKVEARAALAVAIAERDTLALKIAGDQAAATERNRILLLLAENNRIDMEELNETLARNPGWANQPLPDELRRSLQ